MSGESSTPQLSVGTAISDGWTAFRRAPWSFVGFALVSGMLSSLADLIPSVGGLIATILIDLWGTVGVLRGAWIALDGGQPRFADFTRINLAAIWRLFSRQLVLILVLLPITALVLGIALVAADAAEAFEKLVDLSLTTDPTDPSQLDYWLPALNTLKTNLLESSLALGVLLTGWIVGVYIQVSQSFLGYIAVVDGRGPIATIRRGFARVQGQWWQVLGLLVMQVVILLLGLLACVIGLVAAVPVVFCITGAAYRQLFSADDNAGFLKGD